ncbi:hypothetical protein AGMMS49965_06570 [Bacteroidia bacterium]|nr:hypothetical protein AGMMS49965_06570 [Bacteroidia bacterium]
MKKTKFYLLGAMSVALLAFTACESSKPSAYQAVFAAFKAGVPYDPAAPIAGGAKPGGAAKPAGGGDDAAAAAAGFVKDKLTSMDGGTIKKFNVVQGKFVMKNNTTSLKSRLSTDGFSPIVAQDVQGMWRVIVGTFDDIESAVAEKKRFTTKYAPNFQDALLVHQQE